MRTTPPWGRRRSRTGSMRAAPLGVFGTAPGGWGFAWSTTWATRRTRRRRGSRRPRSSTAGSRAQPSRSAIRTPSSPWTSRRARNDTLFLERSSASKIATELQHGRRAGERGMRFFGDRYWAGAYLTGPASGDSTPRRPSASAPSNASRPGAAGQGLQPAPGPGRRPADPGAQQRRRHAEQPDAERPAGAAHRSDRAAEHGRAGHHRPSGHGRPGLRPGDGGDLEEPVLAGRVLLVRGEPRGPAEADFNGWYGQVSWTLTGETPHLQSTGGRLLPDHPAHPFSLSEGQWGAWEIAARLDDVDLNSGFTPGVALSADPEAVDGGDAARRRPSG